jgi:resuscitation-promoting factor RpfA
MNRPSEPFNAEERDLAQRLARLGGPREPAPALDAIILSAARAAVSEPAAPAVTAPVDMPADPKVTPLRPRKPAPRWPLGMGLAASLVLAAGIGWRLQGDGDGSSPEAATASAPAAEESVQAVILEPPLQRTPPPPPPPLADASADAVARRADIAQAPMADAVAKVAPAPSEPDFVADAPMAEVVAQTPAAPPAPAAAAAASNTVAASDSLDTISVNGSRVAAEREVGAAEYTRTPLDARRQQAASQPAGKTTAAAGAAAPAMQSERARGLTGATATDAQERKERDGDKYDDRPPVSADSPEFRQAWLQRIRGHIAKGEQDAARSSLQEFRRRYPDVELPEDLRKLAATLPAP